MKHFLYSFSISSLPSPALVWLTTRAKRVVAADLLRRVLQALPYKTHTVLPDNGVQFTPQPQQWLPGGHGLDRVCREFGVEYCLTKPAHPWINGQVERLNPTLKEATVRRYLLRNHRATQRALTSLFVGLQSY